MSEELYKENILFHYKHPRNFGEIKDPTHESSDGNPQCGDKLNIQLRVEDNKIIEIGFTGKGCAISQGAMSMLTEKVSEMEIGDILRLVSHDIYDLLGVELSPARQKCALLGLEVLQSAASK